MAQTNGVAMKVNSFGFDVQDLMMADTPGNMVSSPFSMYTVLAMLCVGAEGNTKQQIANKVLKSQDSDLTPLLKSLKPLYNSLLNKSKSKFDLANKAWVRKGLDISDTYKHDIQENFDAEIANANFAQPEEAREMINAWVGSKTGEKIKDLFPPGSITSNAALVLANALYFKGAWDKQFDKEDTRKYEFFVTPKDKIEVDFMYAKDKFSMARDEDHKLRLLELPYEGNAYSMVFAIPYETTDDVGQLEDFQDLNNLVGNLKNKTQVFQKWMSDLSEAAKFADDVEIFVPKFQLKSGFELNTYLRNLGVTDVFDIAASDLSGIVSDGPGLYVSSAHHKSFISVDEEGTTAAAATGLVANFRMMPQELWLNHPFLFYIVHKESNVIVFSGKVHNPQQ